MENTELVYKLNAYTKELDSLVSRLERSGLPCDDIEMVYAEVSNRIKAILNETVITQ